MVDKMANLYFENSGAAKELSDDEAQDDIESVDLFKVVGAGYKTHVPQVKKLTLRQRLKGFPIISLIVLAAIVMGCILAPLLANHDPTGFYIKNSNEPPGGEFLLGTDSLGRDLYSMIWFGGRVSILIGIMGAAIVAVIGTVYGSIAGTASSRLESVMMRITEMCGAIPSILLVLILSAVIPGSNIVTLAIVIGVTGWFGLARIVRSEVRQIRNSDYVLYARSCGGRFMYIFKTHLLPNFIPAIMFVVVSAVGSTITTESTLSFFGLGLPVDVISWGSMLSLANKALVMNTWWVIIVPGAFLIATLTCITNIANYYRKENNKAPSNL